MPSSPVPADLRAQLPSNFPSFTSDTIPSRNLRAAYIVHTISRIVTARIFTPFLFSLSRSNSKTNSLLSSLSQHLREKSTRKESVWRQHTLMAAFTMSGAKQNVNNVAASVVEDIMEALKWFSEKSDRESLEVGVRRVVKLAAETWRFARLERELIFAEMPELEDGALASGGSDLWIPFDFATVQGDTASVCSLSLTERQVTAAPSERNLPVGGKILLRLFPVIRREAIHEDLRLQDDEKNDKGYVYSKGYALYDDSASVLAKMQEVELATPSAASSRPQSRSRTSFSAADRSPARGSSSDPNYIPLPRAYNGSQSKTSRISTPPASEGRPSNPPSPLPSPLFPPAHDANSFGERPPGQSTRSTSRTSLNEHTVRDNEPTSIDAEEAREAPEAPPPKKEDHSSSKSTDSATINSEDTGSTSRRTARAATGSTKSNGTESSKNSRFYVESHQAAIKGLYGNTERTKATLMERSNSTGKTASSRSSIKSDRTVPRGRRGRSNTMTDGHEGSKGSCSLEPGNWSADSLHKSDGERAAQVA